MIGTDNHLASTKASTFGALNSISNLAKTLRGIRYGRSDACENKDMFSQPQQQAIMEEEIRKGIPPSFMFLARKWRTTSSSQPQVHMQAKR